MVKTLSLATFFAVLAMSLIMLNDPASPLLWFAAVSTNLIIGRLILAFLVVVVAFFVPRGRVLRTMLGLFGGGMILAGIFGFVSPNFMRTVMPLDIIFAVEAGIIVCLTALSYNPNQETGYSVLGRYRFSETSYSAISLRRIGRKA